MIESNIRKYANLMKELDLTGLEITEDNCVVRLERSAPPSPAAVIPAAAVITDEAKADGAGLTDVLSPMVGVFYAAPAEDAEPFVQVGDPVEKGSTLCIIEAMKLMNEIPAEENGTVAEICVRNGQVVDYGCVLMRIRR